MPWFSGVSSGISSGCLLVCAALAASGQQSSQSPLTARELFYNAVQSQPSAKPANRPKRPPVGATQSAASSPATTASSAPAAQSNSLPEGGHVAPVAARSEAPLGLKYTILRRESGRMIEIPADSVFHSGDAIQVVVQTNSPGYLYIVNQGSSGVWKPLFPSPEIAGGDNRVEAFRTYTLPQRPMVFDEQTGTEKLTILFSRQPVGDFEELIYSLQGRQAKPAAQPYDKPAPKQMIAEAHLDDATVGRLRLASTRDLVIEKVTPATPPDASGTAAGATTGETAVYVVNPVGSENSRLAADLHLVHR